MNDYLQGVVDTCDVLTKTRQEFVEALRKSSGLTLEGIHGHPPIRKILLAKPVGSTVSATKVVK